MKILPIINAEDLANLTQSNLVIVDAGSGDSAYEKYCTEHIDGALYVDLNTDLAQNPVEAKDGGRHPLPSLKRFTRVLQRLGISQNSHVIIYDDKNAANAGARFWWMLRAAGIEKVQVLNGGFQMAKEKGLQINSNSVFARSVDKILLKEWKLPTVDLFFIDEVSENTDYLVIDVREKDRYDGKTEPIDEVAGHIPRAINIPFKENLNEDGTFMNSEILHEKYTEVLKNIPTNNIAVHCGSGVTACHTLLALEYAGFEIPNLYVGSWSEWSRNEKSVAKNT